MVAKYACEVPHLLVNRVPDRGGVEEFVHQQAKHLEPLAGAPLLGLEVAQEPERSRQPSGVRCGAFGLERARRASDACGGVLKLRC
jgi:hypothetical protein